MKNYHLIKVRFYSPTNFKGARIGLISTRFNQRVVLDFDYTFNGPADQAAAWLREHGFNIIGQCELSYNETGIITDTFKPLKEV